MKKLELTKKIPVYSAYLWDGTIESYRKLAKEISGQGGRVQIDFHLNGDSASLNVTDIFGLYSSNKNDDHIDNKYFVMPGQYILFGADGLEILFEGSIKRKYDVTDEKKLYTGPLPLDDWNESAIHPDIDDERAIIK
jgi:hypothetical protein